MKILFIHNFHRKGSASGDDLVFKNEISLLKAHKHNVISFSVSNDEFDKSGIFGKFLFFLGMFWSRKYYKKVQFIIKSERPDIVHIHTFFPLLSPSILYAAKRCSVPVVATLHDTRFICPCATSLRQNKICNECGDGHYFRLFKYGCFKNSRLLSLIVALVFKYHRLRKSFYKQIDRYICLNDSQINLLENIGFNKNKIIKKYNFVIDELPFLQDYYFDYLPSRYVVFFGRIGIEKGIRELMLAWNDLDIPLVIMGSGPLEDEVKCFSEKNKNILFLGYTERSKCLSIVKNSDFVVFPSIWYEGCSMVEIESMSLSKAIIATDLGFSSEAIIDGYNGAKFILGNIESFRKKITELWNDPQKSLSMGKNARKEYEEKYSSEKNYEEIMSCYEGVLPWLYQK